MTLHLRPLLSLLTAATLAAAFSPTPRAAETPASADNEAKLLEVLRSDAPPQEKAITCKKLVIHGTRESVPALAGLLTNPELASWARIALEAIPDKAVDQALRQALPKLEGRLLIGAVNSIGVRRDAEAVTPLAELLQSPDSAVASSAAEALGQIGGEPAARALERALASASPELRSSVAYGCVTCAEHLLAEGKASAAAALCDRVRQADVPKQRILEATRGAILARKSAGIPLLVEQLRSPDLGLFGIGVRTARELEGRDVTQAIARELDQAAPDRQIPLLLALADRKDAAVLPKVLQVAESGPKSLRQTALGLLDSYRDLACVPVLLNGAIDNDPDLSRTAKTSLARLGGQEIDDDLLARLRLASGRSRQTLLELAGQRRIEAAVPVALASTEDSNPGVRRAAVETVGLLGTEKEAGRIVRLLGAAQSPDERDDLERALTSICRRNGARCLPDVLPLAKTGSGEQRKVGLRLLASIGGPEALGVVKGAAGQEENASIQDEAVNLLSTWPNTWPDDEAVAEPLLALAKSAKKPSHQVQGLRGYLLFIEENKKLSNEAKVSEIIELLAFVKGPEEKRQVISVLGTLPTSPALTLLMDLAQDEAVAEEAYLAAARVAADRRVSDAQQRRKALETIVEKSQNEATQKRAADALRRLR